MSRDASDVGGSAACEQNASFFFLVSLLWLHASPPKMPPSHSRPTLSITIQVTYINQVYLLLLLFRLNYTNILEKDLRN